MGYGSRIFSAQSITVRTACVSGRVKTALCETIQKTVFGYQLCATTGKNYIMWNDTDIPLAYLITFRCYGTWLHGDERGSVDRFQNKYESRYIAPNKNWHQFNTKQLKAEVVNLNAKQRQAVEEAIRETCEIRQWLLRAINVRTNHVHTVVSIGAVKPERALNDFKAYSTRKMKQNGGWTSEKSPWSDKGSKRRLWNERSIELAVDYVINGQGDELPKFD